MGKGKEQKIKEYILSLVNGKIEEADELMKLGWEYKTVFPATLENIPHYVLG